MTDHGLTFKDFEILALLREAKEPGTGKTQTRRALKHQPPAECNIHYMLGNESWLAADARSPLRHVWEAWHGPLFNSRPENHLCGLFYARMPVQPGDRVWCREAWHAARSLDETAPRDIPRDADIEHAATARSYAEIGLKGKKRPGIFLPRWASRLTLYVSEVRVQRLQEISEEDALAEGVQRAPGGMWSGAEGQAGTTARAGYGLLWEQLNGPGSWEANPWVAAYTFVPRLGNIDTLPPTLPEHHHG